MKKSFFLVLVFFVIFLVLLCGTSFFAMLEENCMHMKVGIKSSFFNWTYLLHCAVRYMPWCAVFALMMLILYIIKHKFSVPQFAIPYFVLALLLWMLVIPGCSAWYEKIQSDIPISPADSQNLSAGYFRVEGEDLTFVTETQENEREVWRRKVFSERTDVESTAEATGAESVSSKPGEPNASNASGVTSESGAENVSGVGNVPGATNKIVPAISAEDLQEAFADNKLAKAFAESASEVAVPTFADSLIEKATAMPMWWNFAHEKCLLLKAACSSALDKGYFAYILFATMGFALSSVIFLCRFSSWRLINGLVVLVVSAVIVLMNIQFYDESIVQKLPFLGKSWLPLVFNASICVIFMTIGIINWVRHPDSNREER